MFSITLGIIKIIAYVYQALLIFSITLSWFPRAENYQISRVIHKAADWYLHYFSGRANAYDLDIGSLIAVVIYGLVIEFSFTV